jgi:transcriptional regulator with XRE-family HTH domain
MLRLPDQKNEEARKKPKSSDNTQLTNPDGANPVWNREVFARKMRLLRGERSYRTIATKAGLSPEVVRRTEGGELPKIVTLRQIATAAGASEEAWLELVTLWLKTQAGENGAKIRIEVLGQNQREPCPQESPQLAVLVSQLRTLNSSQLEALLDLARSKQKLEGLCSLLGKNPPSNEFREEIQPVTAPRKASELSITNRMTTRDELWASL